jgi:hypothetical protein
MSGRSEEDYIEVFIAIKNKCQALHPIEVTIDCEQAAKSAFLKTFERIEIHHCLTHYSASIHRLINKYNLINEYNNNKKIKHAIMMLKSIVFVPNNSIEKEFHQLENHFAMFKDIRVSKFFNEFFKKFFIIEDEKIHLKKEYRNH